MQKFENDSIVVAEKTQKIDCGIVRIHQGTLVIVENGQQSYYGYIVIYKSLERKNKKYYTEIKEDGLRLATEEEKQAFYKGIRNISQIEKNNLLK